MVSEQTTNSNRRFLAEPQTMGDIITTTTKKDGGSSSISCPMLTATIYTVCAIRMTILLKVHEAWEVVEIESNETEKMTNNNTFVLINPGNAYSPSR